MAILGRTLTVTCTSRAEVDKVLLRLANEPCTLVVKKLLVTIVYVPEQIAV